MIMEPFIIVGLLLVFFLVSVPFFLSRKLSPIPYFPTNTYDVPIVAKLLVALAKKKRQTPHSTIVDLGAGTGEVLFAAAQREPNFSYVLIENNPWLVLLLCIKRLSHKNKHAIKIVYGDMFTMGEIVYQEVGIVYLYSSPTVINKTKKSLESMQIGTFVISYMYTIPGWEDKLVKKVVGKHEIYVYRR